MAILEVLGRVGDKLGNTALSDVSEELKAVLSRLDELKNKLFLRSKKSLNFTNALWEAAVHLENSLDSTGEPAGKKEELLPPWEKVKGALESLEKVVKSHSVIIT
ncbi:MAG: hypothetical protein HYY20_10465 [Candidatus Tectomicrobia bacterium]|uniref:Uncharacterized protein n=1 Tax=Tectimicrobiota bacterium TaxID=2528274 RepID=A0A932CQ89_UNCTE|nr:hypothetical protein [Candidatus Tectomicrobia bacterium]